MTTKIAILLVLVLVAAIAHGAQKDGFWDKLQYKLEKVTPAKKTSSTTAVGGVRGAKNDDAADIYWKGKDKTTEVNDEELQKFDLAVKSKMKGDNELALKQFEEFNAVYPQSTFRVESLQAIERIKLEIAAAKSPPKSEPAAVTPKDAAAPAAATPPVEPSSPPVLEAAPEPVK